MNSRALYLPAVKRAAVLFFVLVLTVIGTAVPAAAMNFEFNDAAKSVVVVASSNGDGTMSLGSGFAIDEHHIITNAHVVTNNYNTSIVCFSETGDNNLGDAYGVNVIAKDSKRDLAILYVSDTRLIPVKLGNADTIKEGDEVYAIGAPEGLAFTLTKGTVSSKLRVANDVRYVQTDAAINTGNSGGPLLNEDGHVIGVNTLKLQNSDNIGFSIRVDTLIEFIGEILGDTPDAGIDVTETEETEETMTETLTEEETVTEDVAVTKDEPDDPSVTTDDGMVYPWSDEEKENPDKDDGMVYPETDAQTPVLPDDDSGGSAMIIIIVVTVMALLGGVTFLVLKLTVFQKSTDEQDTHDVPDEDIYGEKKKQMREDIYENNPAAAPAAGSVIVRGGCICITGGSMSGTRVPLRAGETLVLGKDPALANIIFSEDYKAVSRTHCSVCYNASTGRYYVTDYSTNGTYILNGEKLTRGKIISVPAGTTLVLADKNCTILLK